MVEDSQEAFAAVALQVLTVVWVQPRGSGFFGMSRRVVVYSGYTRYITCLR